MPETTILRFTTAGYSVTERLSVDPGPCQCGDIHDGVAFWHDSQGAWAVRYEDLLTIVEACKAARESATSSDARPTRRDQGKVCGSATKSSSSLLSPVEGRQPVDEETKTDHGR